MHNPVSAIIVIPGSGTSPVLLYEL